MATIHKLKKILAIIAFLHGIFRKVFIVNMSTNTFKTIIAIISNHSEISKLFSNIRVTKNIAIISIIGVMSQHRTSLLFGINSLDNLPTRNNMISSNMITAKDPIIICFIINDHSEYSSESSNE